MGWGDELFFLNTSLSGDSSVKSLKSIPGFGFCYMGIAIISHELDELISHFSIATPLNNKRRRIRFIETRHFSVYLVIDLSGSLIFVRNFSGRRPYIRQLVKTPFGPRLEFEVSHRGRQLDDVVSPLTQGSASGRIRSGNQTGLNVLLSVGCKRQLSFNNKCWPDRYWQKLGRLIESQGWSCTVVGDVSGVMNVGRRVSTDSFLDLVALLKDSDLCVTSEGGVHHLCGFLNVPAVVIYGSFISPLVTGYPTQTSISRPHDGRTALGCGALYPCPLCESTMQEITPEIVFEEVLKTLEPGGNDFGD
jgi:hypothetical protein